jgi:hypothetical protein
VALPGEVDAGRGTRQLDGVERDLDVLRTVLAGRGGNLGVGALVARTGTLCTGDAMGVTS